MLRDLSRLIPVVVLLALWQLSSASGIADPAFLPPPTAVAAAFVDLVASHEMLPNLGATLVSSYAGLAAGALVGIPLGVMMGRSPRIDGFFGPLVRATYTLPKSGLLPLFILWMGLGLKTNTAVVFMASLLPIVIYTFHGVQAVPQFLVWGARSMGTTSWSLIRRIILPAAQPAMLTGLRIALGFSFLLAISSEMIASNAGIGKLMFQYGENGSYDYMFAAAIAVVLVAYVSDRTLLLLTDHLLRWQDPEQRHA